MKNFSNGIEMKFGLDKCAKATFERGRLIKSISMKLENNRTIKEIKEEVYKYLGLNKSNGIQNATTTENITKEYCCSYS